MIIPSILEQTISDLEYRLRSIEAIAPLVQVDMADEQLVGQNSFKDIDKLVSLEPKCKVELHLMTLNPEEYLRKSFPQVSSICTQIEPYILKTTVVDSDNKPSVDFTRLHLFIEKSTALGYRVGVSLNLDTPAEVIEPILDKLDYLQFMSVIPGRQGRQLDERIFLKILRFKTVNLPLLLKNNVKIQVDGGVTLDNFGLLKTAGVNNFVIGSAIFNISDPIVAFNKFKELL